jgi:Bacterial membrane protein YfhO.
VNGERLITIHQSPVTRRNTLSALVAAALPIIFGLLLLAHDPLVFWNDDYEISVLPVFADMARAWNDGGFPLLSPYSWVCGNLAGEFQYGVFSIFINGLIVCIWKLPLTFPQQAAAVSIAHLAVLSAGAFLLARDRQLSTPLSILVALVASLNGWIICWGASDWFGALGAFTWLPWAWWAAERAVNPTRSRWRFLWPAPFVYLLITGGFPYTVLMLVLILVWLTLRSLFEVGTIDLDRPNGSGPSVNRPYLNRQTGIWPLFVGVILGLGLAAPAWLSLLDYVHGSARQSLDPAAHWQWLVPWKAWPGLILPPWTVNWSNFSTKLEPHRAAELACGLIAPAALLAGLVVNSRALLKKIGWELALLLVVFILAMVPTAGVFRWSFRWLPLFHLVLALCAAEALASFSQKQRRFAAFLLLILLLLLISIVAKTRGEHLFPLAWIYLGLALVWLIVESTEFDLVRAWTPTAITLITLLTTFFCIPTNCGVPKYNLAQSLLESHPLDPQRLYLSIYPPPETLYRTETKPVPIGQTVRPGSTSMWAGLRFVNGYSPIRPAGVAREMASAIHGEVDPNLAEWLLQHQANDDGLLQRIGIDGIVVAKEFNFAPQPPSQWQLVTENDEGRVFHRHGQPMPVVRSVNFFGKNSIARITDIAAGRNCVSVSVDVPAGEHPALIAFSRPFFPGYRARINGSKLVVFSERNLIPLVEIPAGMHGYLTLFYRPNWLIYGGAIAIASGAIWIICAIFVLKLCTGRGD